MPDPYFSVEQILSILKETPKRLAALSAGLTPKQLHAAPEPGEWAANEVLAHIRACNEVWGGYIKTMIDQDKPAYKAINPRTWMEKTDFLQDDFQTALRAFTRQRAALLRVLEALPPKGWSRTATVTGVGRVLHPTVLSYADRLARHERPHVKQLERALSVVRAKRG